MAGCFFKHAPEPAHRDSRGAARGLRHESSIFGSKNRTGRLEREYRRYNDTFYGESILGHEHGFQSAIAAVMARSSVLFHIINL